MENDFVIDLLFLTIIVLLIIVYINYLYPYHGAIDIEQTPTISDTLTTKNKTLMNSITPKPRVVHLNYTNYDNKSIILTDDDKCQITIDKLPNETIKYIYGAGVINESHKTITVKNLTTNIIMRTNKRNIIIFHKEKRVVVNFNGTHIIIKNNKCEPQNVTIMGHTYLLNANTTISFPVKIDKIIVNHEVNNTRVEKSYYFVYGGYDGKNIIIRSNYNGSVVYKGVNDEILRPIPNGSVFKYLIKRDNIVGSIIKIYVPKLGKTFKVPIFVPPKISSLKPFRIDVPTFVNDSVIRVNVTGVNGTLYVTINSTYYSDSFQYIVDNNTTAICIPYKVYNPLSNFDLVTLKITDNKTFSLEKIVYVKVDTNRLFKVDVSYSENVFSVTIIKRYPIVVDVTLNVQVITSSGVFMRSIPISKHSYYGNITMDVDGRILMYKLWFEYDGVRFEYISGP